MDHFSGGVIFLSGAQILCRLLYNMSDVERNQPVVQQLHKSRHVSLAQSLSLVFPDRLVASKERSREKLVQVLSEFGGRRIQWSRNMLVVAFDVFDEEVTVEDFRISKSSEDLVNKFSTVHKFMPNRYF